MLRRLFIVCIVFSLLLCACVPTYTLDVPEDEMREYSMVINRVYFIESTKEFYISYNIENYQNGVLFEDWYGKKPINILNYIDGLWEQDFTVEKTDTEVTLLYTGEMDALPDSVTFNTTKKVFIFTEEETGGGMIPGLAYGEELTATGKARICTKECEITLLHSATSLITQRNTIPLPEGVNWYSALLFSDETMIVYGGHRPDYTPCAWAYCIDLNEWKVLVDGPVDFMGKCGDTLYYVKDDELYYSNDTGHSWTAASIPGPQTHTLSLAVFEQDYIVLYYDNKDDDADEVLLVSENRGEDWTVYSHLPYTIESMAVLNDTLFIRTGYYIHMSNDAGKTWTIFDQEVKEGFVAGGTTLYIVHNDGLSFFDGESWCPITLPSFGDPYSFSGSGSALLYERNFGDYPDTLFYTPDYSVGEPWYRLEIENTKRNFCGLAGNTIFISFDYSLDLYTLQP